MESRDDMEGRAIKVKRAIFRKMLAQLRIAAGDLDRKAVTAAEATRQLSDKVKALAEAAAELTKARQAASKSTPRGAARESATPSTRAPRREG